MDIYFKHNTPVWTGLSMQQIVVGAGWAWQGEGDGEGGFGKEEQEKRYKNLWNHHNTGLSHPLYDRSVWLNYSCLNLLCKTGSPISAYTAISPICNSIPHNDTVGKFSTKVTGIPCSHFSLESSSLHGVQLWLPNTQVVSLPYKTGPLPLSPPNPAQSCISRLRWAQVFQDGCAYRPWAYPSQTQGPFQKRNSLQNEF